MKKILVVLLVLAVAGGVFAQEGEWSFNGTAQIGVVIDLDPVPGKEDVLVTSFNSQYNRLYDSWNGMLGEFGINYSRDGFGAGLTIHSRGYLPDVSFIGDLTYAGENFNFQATAPLDNLLAPGPNANFSDDYISALWGNYSFLNGLFFLEAAYYKEGSDFWVSDHTGAFRNWQGMGINSIAGVFNGDGGDVFTHTGDFEYGNYIVGDVRLQGLSFGLMMRNIFRDEILVKTNDGKTHGPYNAPFVDWVLKKMVFGVKFDMSPIEVAAQFLMEDYGVYLGGKWFVGPVTVGLSFMGILGAKTADSVTENTQDPRYLEKITYKPAEITVMKVGGGVNYDADGFGASVKGFLGMLGNKNLAATAIDPFQYVSQIGVEPGFYYNVIPTHLKFTLDAGFYFFSYYAGGKEVTSNVNTVQYALQPQLFWNFLGTGAEGYGGTGIAIRYRLVGGDPKKTDAIPMGLNSRFDVNFKWSF